jgi:hypothetical protein
LVDNKKVECGLTALPPLFKQESLYNQDYGLQAPQALRRGVSGEAVLTETSCLPAEVAGQIPGEVRRP